MRECLEGELVADAMKYLAHYYRKNEPYEELKRFAASSGLGFYKNRGQRRSVVA